MQQVETYLLNSPAHIVIAASVAKAVPAVPMSSAFLLGSVAPDLPLYTMSLVGGLYYTRVKKMTPRDAADLMFNDLFFNNKAWIAVHNLLHAPLLLGLLLVPLAFFLEDAVAAWFFWFLLSCLLHTAIDIPTHHNDGPLLLFPFDWKLRFESPISYWDRAKGARQFMIFEAFLVLILLVYLFGPWFLDRFAFA